MVWSKWIKVFGIVGWTAIPMNPVESAPEVLESLVLQADRAGASDVHLQMVEHRARISFRLDGVLTPVSELSEEIADRVFGRIKYLARLKTYQDSLPQDG